MLPAAESNDRLLGSYLIRGDFLIWGQEIDVIAVRMEDIEPLS